MAENENGEAGQQPSKTDIQRLQVMVKGQEGSGLNYNLLEARDWQEAIAIAITNTAHQINDWIHKITAENAPAICQRTRLQAALALQANFSLNFLQDVAPSVILTIKGAAMVDDKYVVS